MLVNPFYLRDSTEMKTDPFSDILRFTRAEAISTGGFSAGGPWALRFPAPAKIKFFAIVKGHCWVHLDGEPSPLLFNTGDVGLLTAARAFTLSSEPGVEPVDAMEVFSGKKAVAIGNGQDFAHIGGHVLLDSTSGKLLRDVLPPWIHVPADTPQAINFRWMLQQLVDERKTPQPGGELASAQLAQLLFIQILRAHLNTTGPMPNGWLRALGEPRLAPALHLMHGDPAYPWQLEELARACAMSRTTFAARFRNAAGVAPLTYLSNWRMHLAERALREGSEPVASVAQALGYTSESAFSNAFKRVTGASPRSYRSSARKRASTPA
ncbi:AraC family transcriptional regulator [Herbaspirillum sp. LeCh32-8]|uniref:AraC family transcriptional regulator n=1 Tax=Herbaspirillum sp. LeCh32-8 TaxID=2821356 RepID=UPI001AEA6E86|nr:AraC family transcriptional regulator [Herbaspirillum sp. LeCh32-8]MBP0597368.1 AraC family transcriptional regulator [Herbaspirillum sp. LeCh32-8]